MRTALKSLAFLVGFLPTLAAAQQFPTVPQSTVIGRAQSGTGSSQAIPFSQLASSMGLIIGVDVEAWSANLDGFATKSVPAGAVLGTTDTQTLTNKTVNCANNTCTVRYADLPTGTQDTVLGYFGSTTMSASAIPNCTGALIYSTSTHLFSCSTGAGTGTVTTSGSPAAHQTAAGASSLR